MPTVKESSAKRRSYAWMISMIMEEKERMARERLNEINSLQPTLKAAWEEHQRLYNLHIKPLMPQVNEYWANENEKRKLEHFLQAQADHLAKVQADQSNPPNQTPGKRSWSLPPQVEKLPYADKSQVGKKTKRPNNQLNAEQAQSILDQLKGMDQAEFAKLLKDIGGI